MGERGMADMGEMQMELPANTFPMMTGTGPYGPMEMGGMFSVVKVRDDVQHGDYRDPGWYKHPPGAIAYEYQGEVQPAARSRAPKADNRTLSVRKPNGRTNH